MSYTIRQKLRKLVIDRIKQITGEKPKYTKVPRCAYISHGIAFEKDGSVTLEENADINLLTQLVGEGLIEDTEKTVSVESGKTALQFEEGWERYDVLIDTPPESEKSVIRFPLSEHRLDSIRNIVFTIYSKGKLISKATGGDFEISDDLMEILRSDAIIHMEEALEVIQRRGGMNGIRIDSEYVIFDGFPETDEPDTAAAWTDLATAINDIAIKQYHVYPKRKSVENERFDFHSWLTRIGLNGEQYKRTRRILYKNLSGHVAFKTPEVEVRWKKRHNRRKP